MFFLAGAAAPHCVVADSRPIQDAPLRLHRHRLRPARRLLARRAQDGRAPPPVPIHGAGPPRRQRTRGGRAAPEGGAPMPHDGGHGVVRLSELLSAFAKDVAGRIVLGRLRVAAEDDDGWRAKVDALLATFHVGDYVPCLSWVSAVDGTDAKVRKAFKRIYRILEEIVGDADRQVVEAGALDNDAAFVHLLLSLQKGESAGLTEWRLSRDNVKALLEDLFGAGTEATIIVLEWAMAELLRDKGAMQRLQHEVRRAAADNESSLQITEQDLPGMEYLRAVIKETMRLHTPGPLLLPREAMRATRIQGHHDAPAGAMVIVNAWAIARDPEAWEAPEEFRPERFVGSAVDFRGHHTSS
ncbi:hypothetical protein HU200_033959 [Digitaria exilis]|uniref:Cytochrome P450 n=1 Tax=Digitaria exilis TaxID=1010633 RepID=A0A835BI23_9POAL|nr:hypothetical protein HU200_033959 [Digitaria exilis]